VAVACFKILPQISSVRTKDDYEKSPGRESNSRPSECEAGVHNLHSEILTLYI